MIRIFCACLTVLWLIAGQLAAQDLQAIARVDPAQSMVVDGAQGTVEVSMHLSQGLPFKTFTMANPTRVVLDFREAVWDSVTPEGLLNSDRVTQVQFGKNRPGWSRLVLTLAEPMKITLADMIIDPSTGTAVAELRLSPTSMERFLETSTPESGQSALPEGTLTQDTLHVVLDPGHGGVDPGATVDGLKEADLMLSFARELRDVLRALGITVTLTRTEDVFVSLPARIALAHKVQADAFVSLHADTIAQGTARGATVYTLSAEASDRASAELAERLDRDELLSGVDLQGIDDEVAQILMDLARRETGPRGQALAASIVDGLKTGVGRINSKPLRQAGFSVLRAADIPSVLLELGFLSDGKDLSDLRDPAWRARAAAAVADGIQLWAMDDAQVKSLLRQ